MINKNSIMNLKAYKITNNTDSLIAKIFPSLLGNFFKLFYIDVTVGNILALSFPIDKFLQFQTKFGYAILMQKYDNFDNIILEFVDEIFVGVPPYIINKIEFGTEERQKFINICNGFVGKHWNDILEPFLEAYFILFSSAFIIDLQQNHKLTLNLN